MHERARAGNADSALRLLAKTRGLDRCTAASCGPRSPRRCSARAATSWRCTSPRAPCGRSGGRIGLAGYIGGLAAWRLDRPAEAQWLFEAANRAEVASPSLQAGAAFWAARAHLRNRDYPAFAPWMRRAAEARHTFYGLLARRSLGYGPSPDGSRDTLGAADGEALMATPHGRARWRCCRSGRPARGGRAALRCGRRWPAMPA